MESGIAMNVLNSSSRDVEEGPTHFFMAQTSSCLSEILRQNNPLTHYLIFTGYLMPKWSDVTRPYHVPRFVVLTILAWIPRLGVPFTAVYLLADNFIYRPDGVANNVLYFQGIGLLLQVLSMVPFIVLIKKRLERPTRQCDVEFFSNKLNVSVLYSAFAFVCSVLYFTIRPQGITANAVNTKVHGYAFIQDAHFAIVSIGEFLVAVVMSVYILFILVDIEVSIRIVQDLMVNTKNKTLTIEYYDVSRKEIERRVKEHFRPATAVISIGLFNTVSFFLRIFVIGSSQGIGAVFSASNYYMKEIAFIMIAYYHSSLVNELADANIKELGFTVWGGMEEELKRLQVFVNASCHPISFELARLRFKRVDVILKLGSVIAGAVVGFIRLLVISHKVTILQ